MGAHELVIMMFQHHQRHPCSHNFRFDHCDKEEELPDFLPLAGFEFHPEIQVRLGINIFKTQ